MMLPRNLPFAALFLTLLLVVPASAKPPSAGDHLKAQPSQPICSDQDGLKKYLLAAAAEDVKSALELKQCTALPEGTDYILLYIDKGDAGRFMRLAKISVTTKDDTVEGWTVIIQPK